MSLNPVDAVGRRPAARPFGVPVELIGAVLVGAALRLYRLDAESLWLDEAISVGVVRELSWAALLTEFPLVDPHPPLYYAVLRGWTDLAGFSEAAVRFPSAIAGVATIPLVYALGRRLFDRQTAALAAAFVAVSPFQVWYAQEARMYALAVLLCVASFCALVRFVDAPSRRRLVAYAVTTALFGYTHVFALFVVAAQSAFLAGRSVWQPTETDRSAAGTAADRPNGVGAGSDGGDRGSLGTAVTEWAGAQAAVLALLSPWLAVLGWRTVLSGGAGVGIVDWVPQPTPEHLWQLYTLFTFGFARGQVPYWSLTAPPDALLVLPACCLALAALRPGWLVDRLDGVSASVGDLSGTGSETAPSSGGVSTERRQRDRVAVGLLVAWLVVPVVVAYVVSVAVTPVFVHRNLIVAAPAMSLLVARGAVAIPMPPLRYLVAGLLVAGMLVPLPGFYADTQKEQWDEVAAYVEGSADPDDVVLVTPNYLAYPFEYYYDGPAPLAVVEPDATRVDLVTHIRDRDAVYVVTATHLGERERDRFLRRVAKADGTTVSETREFDNVFVYRFDAAGTGEA